MEEENLYDMYMELGYSMSVRTGTIVLEENMESWMEPNRVMMAHNPTPAQNHGSTHSGTWTCNLVTP